MLTSLKIQPEARAHAKSQQSRRLPGVDPRFRGTGRDFRAPGRRPRRLLVRGGAGREDRLREYPQVRERVATINT